MSDIIFFKSSDDFTQRLETNSTQKTELWVWYYKKVSWKPSLTWSESVDSALCYGWIDGIRKSIDNERYKIRFTPRKINSVWSAVNVQKVEKLLKLGKMKPAGMYLFNNRNDKQGYSSDSRNMTLSDEYKEKIKENKKAWEFFNNLAPSYKRDTIWWLMTAKREETQFKRLNIIIESSEQWLKIPMLRKK